MKRRRVCPQPRDERRVGEEQDLYTRLTCVYRRMQTKRNGLETPLQNAKTRAEPHLENADSGLLGLLCADSSRAVLEFKELLQQLKLVASEHLQFASFFCVPCSRQRPLTTKGFDQKHATVVGRGARCVFALTTKGYDHRTPIRTSFDQRFNRHSQLSPSVQAPTRNIQVCAWERTRDDAQRRGRALVLVAAAAAAHSFAWPLCCEVGSAPGMMPSVAVAHSFS